VQGAGADLQQVLHLGDALHPLQGLGQGRGQRLDDLLQGGEPGQRLQIGHSQAVTTVQQLEKGLGGGEAVSEPKAQQPVEVELVEHHPDQPAQPLLIPPRHPQGVDPQPLHELAVDGGGCRHLRTGGDHTAAGENMNSDMAVDRCV